MMRDEFGPYKFKSIKLMYLLLSLSVSILPGCAFVYGVDPFSGTLYGCFHPFRYDGTYKGQVIDAETRQPIEGAIVVGSWNLIFPNVAGGHHKNYDAREAITDANGKFSINGQGIQIISNLEPMDILIFKAGYEHFGSLAWRSIKIAYSDEIKWEKDMPIIPIKKLTLEERKKSYGPSMPTLTADSRKSLKLIWREIDKDDIERGLKRN